MYSFIHEAWVAVNNNGTILKRTKGADELFGKKVKTSVVVEPFERSAGVNNIVTAAGRHHLEGISGINSGGSVGEPFERTTGVNSEVVDRETIEGPTGVISVGFGEEHMERTAGDNSEVAGSKPIEGPTGVNSVVDDEELMERTAGDNRVVALRNPMERTARLWLPARVYDQ